MRNETSGGCGTYGRKQKCIQTFGAETWMERRLVRPWGGSITLKRLFRKDDGVVWIGLIWLGTDRYKCRAVVHGAINCRLPKNAANFSTT